MTSLRRTFQVILLLALAGLGSSRLNPQVITDAPKKTLGRVDDPVIMTGKDMRPLFGCDTGNLSLMIADGKGFSPIPFQIDQVKPNGMYAFDQGPKPSRDPHPGLDPNDELAFMIRDAGGRAGAGSWPEGAIAGVEIEIMDPRDGGKAWAYLFRFADQAPRSKTDYIKYEYDPNSLHRKVTTQQYVMKLKANETVPDYIALVKKDGTIGPDIVDKLKVRGEFILRGDVRFPFIGDEWIKCNVEAYIDGPIRVLEFGSGYLDLSSFMKLEGQGYATYAYYDNHVIWPQYLEVPFDLRGVVKEWPIRGFMDFNENIYGTHAFSAANPYSEDVVFDGKMSEAEKNLDTTTEIDWVAGFGPQGAMVSRLPSPPEWKGIKKLPYYLDDATAVDEPEDHPGVSGIGYRLLGFEKLGKWTTTYYQYYYFKRELKPETVHLILDILDHPLQVKVKVLEKP